MSEKQRFKYNPILYYTMSFKIKCECGQIIEGLTQGQAEHLIKQHRLGRIHKRAIEKQQNAKK